MPSAMETAVEAETESIVNHHEFIINRRMFYGKIKGIFHKRNYP